MTYSFLDVVASLVGPGAQISLGAGAANAEEGISIEMTEETDTMKIGADGQVVHELHASKAGKVTVRLLKTSPQNAQLQAIYNYQRTSSAFWGKNTFSIANPTTGDSYSCAYAAFVRMPNNSWGKETGTIDWEFNCSSISAVIGAVTF